MNILFWRTDSRMPRPRPPIPRQRSVQRGDDRPALNGTNFNDIHGLRWSFVPKEHAPQTHSLRWKRWGNKGICAGMMVGTASGEPVPKRLKFAARLLKAHRTTTRLRSEKRGTDDQRCRLIG